MENVWIGAKALALQKALEAAALSKQEKMEVLLMSLMRQSGFRRCRLSQFDEYELFDRNRAFLEGDKMLTFTDPYGKLQALRPDVTLSVMKQAAACPAKSFHVYYMENVFRLSAETHQFEAHRQMGVEAIEWEKPAPVVQVLTLAQQTLAYLGAPSVLVLSHMEVLARHRWYRKQAQEEQDLILRQIGQKNTHDLKKSLEMLGCPREELRTLLALTRLCASPEEVLRQIREQALGETLESAALEVCKAAAQLPIGKGQQVLLDFSLVNPLSYYQGLVFQGFLHGCSGYVLSGGCYDQLARRFAKQESGQAIGFAVELGTLERLWSQEEAALC